VSSASEIIDHPSPNHSPRKKDVRVDTVLIHHTATSLSDAGSRSALRALCEPNPAPPRGPVSAHYVVDSRGDVYRLVPEDMKAWHAGKGRLPWETCPEYDFNHRSVGIEIVNPGDGKTPFTEAQYRALEWLVPDVIHRMDAREVVCVEGWRKKCPRMDTRGIVWVLGHRDVAPGRKTDPADNFDWGRIRAALSGGQS
jgi:N-acetylmuramoyl-L-alanine amidase